MPALLIASLAHGDGRTTAAAAFGALLAGSGRDLRLLRVRSDQESDPAAEDDARLLSVVPGCDAPAAAVTEQQAGTEAKGAKGDASLTLIETPPGVPADLAARLSARVVLVSAHADGARLGDLAAAARAFGDAFLGVIILRQPQRGLDRVRAAVEERGLACLGVVPEDALLAGPTVRELAETLQASRLTDGADEDEAVESVMLGPISADPGQPYFLQRPNKAVINRIDKMDLHLAALAAEPDCLIVTSNRTMSPYLIDRLRGADAEGVTVLHAPEGTVRTVELLDDLFGRTRFSGRRKIERAAALFGECAAALSSALGSS